MEREQIIFGDTPVGCNLRSLEFFSDSSFRSDHFHEEVEFVYVESGQILCRVSGEEIILSQGSVLLIGARAIHRLDYLNSHARVTYLQINIDNICSTLFPHASLFSFFYTLHSKKYGLFSADSGIGQLFFFICKELEAKNDHYATAIEGSVFLLVTFMCREGLMTDGLEYMHDSSYQKFLPALTYAQENFSTEITLDKLCAFLKVDKYHFCRQFKKVTGATFFDYLIFLRLKHAEKLLISTDKTVTEIAMECGFSSAQYFSRVFSTEHSCSPRAYRRMINGR